MSTIIFEGNTYTFGATVSANPGTGTTSYVFGGLSSGWTYGFIIWAFNGVGPSSTVGPINYSTFAENLEENRSLITALEWSSPYVPISTANLYIDPTPINNTNLFLSSDNLTPSSAGGLGSSDDYGWSTSGISIAFIPPLSITTGFTAPDGSTTAWKFTSSSATGWALEKRMQLETGKTYYLSFYHDLSRGNTGTLNYPFMYWLGGVLPSIKWQPNQQILPVVGAMVTGAASASFGSATGWTRFAFQFFTNSGYSDGSRLVMGFMEIPAASTYGLCAADRYYWGPQLELAT